MFKEIIKWFFKRYNNFYQILSYIYNYPKKGYLPKKIESIEIILENLSKSQSIVSFVQVGSNDGVSGDPIYRFISHYNWEGVLIEPIPFLFEKLKSNYAAKKDKLSFLNVAVSAEEGSQKTLYTIDENYRGKLPDWYFQLATFNKDILYNHNLPDVDKYIKPIEVPTITIQKIIYTYRKDRIDLLHIDTEGYDFEILKTIDLSETTPKIILIEYIHLDIADRKKMISLLKLKLYKIYRCNNDFICIYNSFHDKFFKGARKSRFWE